jgi:hypothetical protein
LQCRSAPPRAEGGDQGDERQDQCYSAHEPRLAQRMAATGRATSLPLNVFESGDLAGARTLARTFDPAQEAWIVEEP